MSTIPISQLIGPALRWAVASALGHTIEQANHLGRLRVLDAGGRCLGSFMADGSPLPSYLQAWAPDEDWAQGGPIIDREQMQLMRSLDGVWSAILPHGMAHKCAPTPLIAAMRALVYLASGEEKVWLPSGVMP